jgi:dienelactone hydrolase
VSSTAERGVVERRFDLKVADAVVPGIQWLPEHASEPYPTVLVGHGGTQHKRVPNVLALARRLVRHLGFGVVALDAPEHGDRVTDAAALNTSREQLAASIESGRPMNRDRLKEVARRAPQHVAEWRALIDDLQTDDRFAAGPFGYWGVSMGTHHGVPLVAEEPRISAAVFGLFGVGGERDRFRAFAARVTVPVLFLFQWDDRLMTRQAGLDLWDAFASTEKTMHINPGGHLGIPGFEMHAVEAFFARHLR